MSGAPSRAFRVAGSAALACALCAAVAGAEAASEPAEVARLAETLSRLGMHELLAQLVADNQGSPGIRRIDAEARILRAIDSVDRARRDRLLDEAAVLLEEELAALRGGGAETEMDRFRLLLKLAVTRGLVQGEPYATRILLLHGTPDDRRALGEAVEQALANLDRLQTGLREAGIRWRGNMRVWMIHGADLEALRDEATYRSAWIHLYHALSLGEGPQRTRVLRLALDAAAEFREAASSADLQMQSQYLSGIVLRELGEYRSAGTRLEQAVKETSDREQEIPIRFESLRNEVERARALLLAGRDPSSELTEAEARSAVAEARSRFRQAREAIDRFAETSEGEPVALRRQRRLRASLLRAYLFETRAELQEDETEAVSHRDAAEGALLDFLETHSDQAVQDAFLDLLRSRWREEAPPEAKGSIALLARAAWKQSLGREGEREPLRDAADLLGILRWQEGTAADRLRPLALWRLGIVRNQLLENLPAAEAFGELADGFPQHALALPAARNAVQSLYGAVRERTEAGKEIAAELRGEYVDALRRLVGNPSWVAHTDVAPWNFQLGEQLELLYEQSDDRAASLDLLGEAVEAYQAVPAGLPESIQARSRALRCRFRLLADDPRRPAGRYLVARQLREDLASFAREADRLSQKSQSSGRVADLRRWGSTAEFLAARASLEFLGQQSEGMALLAKLPERWPGTDIVPRGEAYRIRKLVEIGQTRQAVDALDQFTREFPSESRDLLPLVIRQVRRRIASLRGLAGAEADLQRYRDNYLELARELYERVSDRPLDKRYWITQTYADALVEAGQAKDGLALFRKCQAHEAEVRAQRQEELDRQFAPHIRAVEESEGVDALAELRSRLKGLIEESGIDPESSSQLAAVDRAWAYYLRGEDEAERSSRTQAVRRALRDGLTALRDALKRRLPLDARNLAGLAGAYRGLGEELRQQGQEAEAREAHIQALRYYRQLLSGLDPAEDEDRELFWEMQLGFCECVLSGFSGSVDAMADLQGRIRGLHQRDPAMGGYYARFNAIEAEAARLSGG